MFPNTVGVQAEQEEVPHYAEGAEYLRSIGFRNASEISRVLDIAMNPNSLYLKDRHKRRSVNSSVSIGIIEQGSLVSYEACPLQKMSKDDDAAAAGKAFECTE